LCDESERDGNDNVLTDEDKGDVNEKEGEEEVKAEIDSPCDNNTDDSDAHNNEDGDDDTADGNGDEEEEDDVEVKCPGGPRRDGHTGNVDVWEDCNGGAETFDNEVTGALADFVVVFVRRGSTKASGGGGTDRISGGSAAYSRRLPVILKVSEVSNVILKVSNVIPGIFLFSESRRTTSATSLHETFQVRNPCPTNERRMQTNVMEKKEKLEREREHTEKYIGQLRSETRPHPSMDQTPVPNFPKPKKKTRDTYEKKKTVCAKRRSL
jgi:hypothetical protein